MVTITGNVVVAMGASGGDKEDVTNVKRLVYRSVPDRYQPQTVMNTTPPLGFKRPHKYIVGELHVLSEAHHAFKHNGTGNVAYIVPAGDNVEVPYFVATQTDSAGGVWTYTFTGLVPVDEPMMVNDGEDVIQVYPFVAKYCTVTPPA